LRDSDGYTYQLSSLRGQVVLIEFFSTNCPHCERSVPVMQQIKDRYGPLGTQVLAIHCRDGSNADPVGFVRRGGHDYPVLLEGNGVANQYSVRTIPLLLVVGPDGNLVYQQTGFGANSGARLMSIIEEHLPG
ncbi:MAG: TlpA disulfide reductase family protein, partial [Planctomycetota bacterium]